MMNLKILKVCRSLLSEFRMHSCNWNLLLPLMQGALSHTPIPRCGGFAPVTVMTCLSPSNPLDGILDLTRSHFPTVRIGPNAMREKFAGFGTALDQMHKSVQELREHGRNRKPEPANVNRIHVDC
jgi:hypothetical protein